MIWEWILAWIGLPLGLILWRILGSWGLNINYNQPFSLTKNTTGAKHGSD